MHNKPQKEPGQKQNKSIALYIPDELSKKILIKMLKQQGYSIIEWPSLAQEFPDPSQESSIAGVILDTTSTSDAHAPVQEAVPWLEDQRQKQVPLPIIVLVNEISHSELNATMADFSPEPLEDNDRIFLLEKDFDNIKEVLLHRLPEPLTKSGSNQQTEQTPPRQDASSSQEEKATSPELLEETAVEPAVGSISLPKQKKQEKKEAETKGEKEEKDEKGEKEDQASVKLASPSEPIAQTLEPEGSDLSTRILLADDSRPVRSFVTKILQEKGYTVDTFENGRELLDFLQEQKIGDIILLDNQMPEMDGITTLKALKDNEELKELPVLFLSALTDKETVVQALELGADDYMEKPFNNNEFLARINVHVRIDLLKKRVLQEKEKSDQLLLNTLPKKIVQDLKTWGTTEPETFPEVTVFFSDIVGFTSHSSQLKPGHLISELNNIFTEFDNIMERNHCERIKTIGDAYLAVCGMPQANPHHASHILQAALEILDYIEKRNRESQESWQLRVGVHSGSVVGGIVGIKKYIYDIFGDSINTAARMESNSLPMHINVSEATYNLTSHLFSFEARPPAEIKGKGRMQMYFVQRDTDSTGSPPDDKSPPREERLERQIGLRQSKEHFSKHDYQGALAILERTVYDDTQDATVHQLLGSIHYKLGHYDQCHYHWQKALLLNPDNDKLQQNLKRLNHKLAPSPKD